MVDKHDQVLERTHALERDTADAERLAFAAKNGIELTDVQLEGIAGGRKNNDPTGCPESFLGLGLHDWELTGRTRPGEIWGDTWPDYEKRCKKCGRVEWQMLKWSL